MASYTEHHQGNNWRRKKKRWTKIEFWRILELMAHLEDDLCLETTHSLFEKTFYDKHLLEDHKYFLKDILP